MTTSIKDILEKGKAAKSNGLQEVKNLEDEQAYEQNYQWEPAPALDQLDGLDRERWAYRWVDYSNSQRLSRFVAEGWTFVNALEGDTVVHNVQGKRLTGWINDPKHIQSTFREERGLILMKIPRKMAEARKRYYEGLTNEKTQSVTNQAKESGMQAGGIIHGEIKIQQPNAGMKIIG